MYPYMNIFMRSSPKEATYHGRVQVSPQPHRQSLRCDSLEAKLCYAPKLKKILLSITSKYMSIQGCKLI
jgi:hypothetical protein